MKLWVKILIALVLGVIAGLVFGPATEHLRIIGDIFLRLINMIIVLLIFSSMTIGITSIHDPEKLGRVGLKTILIFLTTTAIAILLGLGLGKLFGVGKGLALKPIQALDLKEPPSVGSIILDIFPSNPIESMVEGNALQIIVFAIFLGLSINFAGERGKPLKELLESLADVMYRLTSIIMEFSPIGVFAIMAWVAGSFGFDAIIQLSKFLVTYYIAAFLHIGLVFCGILWFLARVHPWPFFRGMGDAIAMAFSTCSSSATMPVTMHCVQENLGVSKNITNFVIPLGATVNMNGAALYQGMAVVFIANAYQIDLSIIQLITIVLTATLSAIGAAGIPGTGFIMLSAVLVSAGLPLEGLAVLAGIDRVREMISTVLNVTGDAVSAVYVAKQENEFDERQYYHEDLVEMDKT
jgi:Na+/H+-dicarboxylate symporter